MEEFWRIRKTETGLRQSRGGDSWRQGQGGYVGRTHNRQGEEESEWILKKK